MDRSTQSGTFTGSVDAFLNHCENINVDELYSNCEKRECIEHIMRELKCTHDVASGVYDELVLSEVQNTVDDLVQDGLVEITGYNDAGEPLFSLTELGKQVQNEVNKDNQ
jgi:hypothetical protein